MSYVITIEIHNKDGADVNWAEDAALQIEGQAKDLASEFPVDVSVSVDLVVGGDQP